MANNNNISWSLEVGFYPGILFGLRINVVGQNGNDGLHYHDIEINEAETL